MTVKFLSKTFNATVLFVAMAAGAAANAGTPYMRTGDLTSQPIGHYDLCRQMPGECQARSKGGVLSLTSGMWRQLVEVNTAVNDAIRPATDEQMFGQPEVWFFPTTQGDCEDYVLLKRRTLMRQGWPAGALLITVVRKPDGEGHAVLTVRTDRGDLILDNLQSDIRIWSDTEYTFIKRQSEVDAGLWVSIVDDRETYVGAVGR